MAPRLRSAVVRFDALPEPVLRILFLALPVDERARAACVCRSWRAFLADPSLWQVLDLGGWAAERMTENLVRRAVARAAGGLRVLSLDDDDLLVKVFVSDGAELREVNTNCWLDGADLGAIFAAAPRLQVLNACVAGRCTGVLPFLRNEPPYGPLRLSAVDASFDAPAAEVLAFAAAAAAHEPLKGLYLAYADFAPGLNALVGAAAERRVAALRVVECVLDAESIPALARLLQRGSLTKLDIGCDDFPGADEARVLELWAAMRTCHTLTHVELQLNPPNGVNCRIFTELLDAAAALPDLSVLDLSFSELQDKGAAGRALGALLGANLPSLRTLRVTDCQLGDEGVGPLLDGLAANTHLRELDCGRNALSLAFVLDHLEPALAALAARTELDA